MANVNVKFNNKDYLLSCDDGQEENLIELANHLDSKYSELRKNLGNIGENKLLLITAIKMIDDYFDLFKKIAPKHQPIANFKNATLLLQMKLKENNLNLFDFRRSKELIRLNTLNDLIEKKYLNKQLFWRK